MSVEKKLAVIRQFKKKLNELFSYAVMLGSFVLAYEQFVIMQTELQKVQIQELKCLCSKTTTVLSARTYQKLRMWVSYIFIAVEINKYIV
jgi:hypothetical protein